MAVTKQRLARMLKKTSIVIGCIIVCASVCLGQEQTQQEYYPGGTLKTEISFRDGKIHGELKKYYESGALRSVVPYVQGQKQGLVRGYYESGELAVEVVYVDDERQGEAVYYDKQGDVLEEEYWDSVAGQLNEILSEALKRQ